MSSNYTSNTVHKNAAGEVVTSAPSSLTKNNNIWIRTSARRSSLARISMQMRTLPAYMIYNSENGAEQRFDIVKPILTIGRRDNNDIVLQCPLISKDHASIEKDKHGYFIRDHRSANGVLINDEQINVAAYLQDGDELQIGSITLKFFDEVEMTDSNWKDMMESHPGLAGTVNDYEKSLLNDEDSTEMFKPSTARGSLTGLLEVDEPEVADTAPSSANFPETGRRLSRKSIKLQDRTISDKHLSLVTILPSEQKYEESITVRAEIDGSSTDNDFQPVSDIEDTNVLRDDYEKLRLAYELSKLGLTEINTLLEKTLELMFSVLKVNRGVVLLVDRKTGMLTIDKVKLREGTGVEDKEILLSYTILMKVLTTQRCLITSDAFEDPLLGKAASIARSKIRSVICVPLISRGEVHGILHLDSQDRINTFAEKDLALVKAISNQCAMALENCKLVKDIEKEAMIRENLGRFLPPHVVEKCISKGEEPVRKGGRNTKGTILFADIRGFTQMSERSTPQEVVDVLNDFFERLVQIVFKYDGILDKYIGDCLMADFGTLPGQERMSEMKAVCAALEFKVAVMQINQERAKAGKEPLTIGIGLNTGDLVAGYIGSSQRLEYTCIGDTVNTASRICSMAYDNQVLVSEFTYNLIADQVDGVFVGKQAFKGKSTETSVYEIHSVLPNADIVKDYAVSD